MSSTRKVESQKNLQEWSPVARYENDFKVSGAYRAELPDIQNADKSSILGANVPIMQVGMHNFKLPLKLNYMKET